MMKCGSFYLNDPVSIHTVIRFAVQTWFANIKIPLIPRTRQAGFPTPVSVAPNS